MGFFHQVTPDFSRSDIEPGVGSLRGGRRAASGMTHQSSFAPRDLLTHPADFGREINVTWRYAKSLDEAVRLSRSIDQRM